MREPSADYITIGTDDILLASKDTSYITGVDNFFLHYSASNIINTTNVYIIASHLLTQKKQHAKSKQAQQCKTGNHKKLSWTLNLADK